MSEILLPDVVNEEEYQQLPIAEDLWKSMVKPDALQPAHKSLQASWDEPVYSFKYEQLLAKQTTPAESARLRAVASENASSWLNATPVPSLGLKLDDTSLRICCGLRLGSQICHSYTCTCGNLVDPTGRHGLSCAFAKGRASRHFQANDLIKRALASADVPAVLEPLGLSNNNNERPDGLSLFPWREGKNIVWDFTCCDTLAWSHVSSTSKEAGLAAENAEKKKLAKYEYLRNGYILTPIAVETLGSWGQMGLKFIKDLGSRIADRTGDMRSTSYLFQSLSVAVQRGNAASVMGTIPPTKKLDELYLL